MDLGSAITNCRERKGWSERELAKLTNVSHNYISLLERNERNCTMAVIERLADILNIPLFLLYYLALDEDEIQLFSDDLVVRLDHEILAYWEKENG